MEKDARMTKSGDISWERKRFKKNKVWVALDDDGGLLKKNGKVLVKYQLNQDYEYWVHEAAIQPLGASPEIQSGKISGKGPEAGSGGKKKSRKTARSKEASEFQEPDSSQCVVIYTDGASSGNPGPSGIGVFLKYKDQEKEISKSIGHSTNNIAELEAVRIGLSQLKNPNLPVKILTDSSYVCGTLTKGWKAKKNVELIAAIKEIMEPFKDLEFIHVKGHAGLEGNEKADQLARDGVAQGLEDGQP